MPAERHEEMNWLHWDVQNVKKKTMLISFSPDWFSLQQGSVSQTILCTSDCSCLPMKDVLGKVNNWDWVNAYLAANPNWHTTGSGPSGTILRSKHFTTEARNKSVKKRTCSPCTIHIEAISKPFSRHFQAIFNLQNWWTSQSAASSSAKTASGVLRILSNSASKPGISPAA